MLIKDEYRSYLRGKYIFFIITSVLYMSVFGRKNNENVPVRTVMPPVHGAGHHILGTVYLNISTIPDIVRVFLFALIAAILTVVLWAFFSALE